MLHAYTDPKVEQKLGLKFDKETRSVKTYANYLKIISQGYDYENENNFENKNSPLEDNIKDLIKKIKVTQVPSQKINELGKFNAVFALIFSHILAGVRPVSHLQHYASQELLKDLIKLIQEHKQKQNNLNESILSKETVFVKHVYLDYADNGSCEVIVILLGLNTTRCVTLKCEKHHQGYICKQATIDIDGELVVFG